MKWLDDKLEHSEFITAEDFYNHFGFNNVVGVSHAGLNAIAGPIYVAAVIISPFKLIDGLDKKSYSEKEIDRLATTIWNNAVYVRTGVISNLDINSRGKLEALQFGLIESLLPFSQYNPVSCIIIDTIKMEPIRYQFEGIPIIVRKKISDKIDCLSAASLIAKQAHIAFMKNISLVYPDYKWESNYGYGTKEHNKTIKELGWTLFHRMPSKLKKESS